ncbi:antitoxin Xre/MbcA/ParS toxin-binding domain-containing protein [Salinicola sp. MIT1003]|jgi:putative toxin-antitoxin system antitoxin component (TIGR02293 family)|uniref:antitoxin Xre/MbcA/ParS toxin-binding domain-containing protein n=1 Tax=Salinicola sp. MIT1003 TaxID=1882734 RepID=UPI0008DD2385|nr:antitoxin Xre/MbcA/ParS toxin-binding domain-containing protein [Salinicola sp. MIT1003]OHZ01209.1 hypothetical protein BC443_12370 [Salinicola sp. MIT1003]
MEKNLAERRGVMALKGVNIPESVFHDQREYIKVVRHGIQGSVIKEAMIAMGVNRDVFLRLLDVDSSNLSKYYRRRLHRKDSEEVLDTLRVYREAVNVFGNVEVARDWLGTPINALSGSKPIDMFDTSEGRSLVRSILRKIEHGEFS